MKLLNRYTNEVIIERDVSTMKQLVEIARTESVSLREADLCGADLYKADLYKADLVGANLYGSNLDRARNYYSFIAYDTSKRLVHCIKYKDTWKVQAGCFWGTLKELEAKVKKVHNSKVYLANIEILKEL